MGLFTPMLQVLRQQWILHHIIFSITEHIGFAFFRYSTQFDRQRVVGFGIMLDRVIVSPRPVEKFSAA